MTGQGSRLQFGRTAPATSQPGGFVDGSKVGQSWASVNRFQDIQGAGQREALGKASRAAGCCSPFFSAWGCFGCFLLGKRRAVKARLLTPLGFL